MVDGESDCTKSVLVGATGNPYPCLTPPSNPPCASAMIFCRLQPKIKHLETGTCGFLLVQGVTRPPQETSAPGAGSLQQAAGVGRDGETLLEPTLPKTSLTHSARSCPSPCSQLRDLSQPRREREASPLLPQAESAAVPAHTRFCKDDGREKKEAVCLQMHAPKSLFPHSGFTATATRLLFVTTALLPSVGAPLFPPLFLHIFPSFFPFCVFPHFLRFHLLVPLSR